MGRKSDLWHKSWHKQWETRNALPETEKFKINALFVQFYGGERAWSLGEAYAPEALRADEDDSW